jgi:8-amino-7-oxononanoate synthase
MADFTSALFLGRRHAAVTLPPWPSLTSGRPAAMDEAPGAAEAAARVAAAVRSAAGVLHRSTLHALWDLVDLLARPGGSVAIDEAAYPLSRWAAAGAAARAVRVTPYAHHDPGSLAGTAGARPLVLTDGWCSGCGQPAPLAELGRVAAAHGGRLIVDDTLAVGLFGRRRGAPGDPYGLGGGGTFAWLGQEPGAAVVVASLAKSYGSPVTVTCGPGELVARLRSYGSRWHSSPATAAEVAAALAACTDETGNRARRRHLAGLVHRLRDGLLGLGLRVDPGPSPLVTVDGPAGQPLALHRALAAAGVAALLRRPRCRGGPVLTLAVSAAHRPRDIDEAVAALRAARGQQAAQPGAELVGGAGR